MPGAVDEQPLLRAVAEHALVVDRRGRARVCAHAELVEQLDHLDRARARAAAGSARRAGSACRRARGRGCCRRRCLRARAGARRRRRRAAARAPRPARRCRRRRRSRRRAASRRRRQCAGLAGGGPLRSRWPRSARRADPAAVEARRGAARSRRAAPAPPPSAAARTPRRVGPRQARAHRCTLPHSSSKVCTSTWFDSRFTSAGTRAMSGGKSNSAGRPWQRRGSAGPRGSAVGMPERAPAGDDEAPFAEARHVRVVRRGRAGRPPRSSSTTVQKLLRAISGEVVCTPRSRSAARCRSTQLVEARGVELAEREVGRVGEVDDDRVEDLVVLLEPGEGVGVDDRAPCGERSASPFRPRSSGCGREQLRHVRVELDQRDLLDARVLEHLAHRHAVAAAEHEHAPRRAVRGQRRVHQRLVVAVLVARVELQVAVEEQAHAGVADGDDDALVGAGLA